MPVVSMAYESRLSGKLCARCTCVIHAGLCRPLRINAVADALVQLRR
jgi:hypothetical protein